MVFNGHQVSGMEVGINTAGSIGHNENFNSQCGQSSDRMDDLLHHMTFISVHATLKCYDWYAVNFT